MRKYMIEALEAQVARLEEELSAARKIIFQMPPVEFRRIISTFIVGGGDDFYSAQQKAIDQILELAKPDLPQGSYWTESPRFPCPLCRAVPANVVYPSEGFTYPIGLRRHLEGYGNSEPCVVLRTAEKVISERSRNPRGGRV